MPHFTFSRSHRAVLTTALAALLLGCATKSPTHEPDEQGDDAAVAPLPGKDASVRKDSTVKPAVDVAATTEERDTNRDPGGSAEAGPGGLDATVRDAEATLPGSLPAPWKSRDIGAMKLKGSAQYASGVFTINSTGPEFWHGEDFYHFVYQPLTGDGEIVARIVSIGKGDDGFEDAGVLFSYDPDFTWINNTDPSAKHAPGAKMMWVRTQGVAWGQRVRSLPPNNGWGPGPSVISKKADLPVWVKVVRAGKKFSGFYSTDGKTWLAPPPNARNQVAVAELPEVPETIWVGVFLCPHTKDRLVEAKIDNVTVTPAP